MLRSPTNSSSDSFGNKLAKCVFSAIIGMIIGVLVAEVVSNSLTEISITPEFAIIFGCAFILLGSALCWRIVKTVEEPTKRSLFLAFAVLILVSGLFSFFLERSWFDIPTGIKIPMYAVVGLALSFALTFSLTELINMGVCQKCCHNDFENNPLIGTKFQIFAIFAASLIVGAIFGVLFGTIDVEDDTANHSRFKENLILSIPIGGVTGGFVGFINQWVRSDPTSSYKVISRSPLLADTSVGNI